MGIKYVQMMGIDNVLSKPADPFFVGWAESMNYDVSSKFFLRVRK